jgi:hypothetical protein
MDGRGLDMSSSLLQIVTRITTFIYTLLFPKMHTLVTVSPCSGSHGCPQQPAQKQVPQGSQ